MQWKARKRDLLEDLQLVQGIVETRTTIPILANLLLRAGKDHVDLLSTDLQVGLRTRFPAKVKKQGETTLSAKKLFEIVRALPDMDVEFQQESSGGVEIRCESSRFRLQTLPPEDYPAVPAADMSGGVRFPLRALQEMIERVLFDVGDHHTGACLGEPTGHGAPSSDPAAGIVGATPPPWSSPSGRGRRCAA